MDIQRLFPGTKPGDTEETAFIHSNYLDNEFLSDDYVAVLDRNRVINSEYYEVYTLGNWGSLKGAIYNSFKQTVDFPPDGVGHTVTGCTLDTTTLLRLVKIQTVGRATVGTVVSDGANVYDYTTDG